MSNYQGPGKIGAVLIGGPVLLLGLIIGIVGNIMYAIHKYRER